MAAPSDFAPIAMRHRDIQAGRRQMRDMLGRQRLTPQQCLNAVGFAAEHAVLGACKLATFPARSLDHDLVVARGNDSLRLELKTRVARRGWVHPGMFDYITVPTHDGREPIKPAADLVVFNWWSADAPRTLWVLGHVKGVDEFKRRAVYYPEGAPLPRGGWADKGGAWVIEVGQLRPMPAAMFQEREL